MWVNVKVTGGLNILSVSLEVFPSSDPFACKAIWENQVVWSKTLFKHKAAKTEKGTFSVKSQETPLHHNRSPKGRNGGVNKKVSNAVFRAWTDKQKKFLCALPNATQHCKQARSIGTSCHPEMFRGKYPECRPCDSAALIAPESLQRGDSCSDSFPPRCSRPRWIQTLNDCQRCQAPVKVKQQRAPRSPAMGAEAATVSQSR